MHFFSFITYLHLLQSIKTPQSALKIGRDSAKRTFPERDGAKNVMQGKLKNVTINKNARLYKYILDYMAIKWNKLTHTHVYNVAFHSITRHVRQIHLCALT